MAGMMMGAGAPPQRGQQPGQPQGQPPEDPMAQGPAAGPDPMAEGDGTQPTEEEQAMYDQVVTNGSKLIYSPEIRKIVQQNLSGDGNPIEGFANTMVLLVSRITASAKENGIKIPGDVLYAASQELMDLLIEYAGEARIATLDEKQTEQAWYLALDMYRQQLEAAGEIDQESMAEDMQAVAQAEKDGTLGQMLPGIDEAPAPEQGQDQAAAPGEMPA